MVTNDVGDAMMKAVGMIPMLQVPAAGASPRRRVVVLQGVSGSGKTTYAHTLAEGVRADNRQVGIVSADDFFIELGGGTYKFDGARIQDAHNACFRRFVALLTGEGAAHGVPMDLVVVDNTNTTAVEISPYVLAAQAFDFDVEVHRVICDPAVAAARSVHNVPTTAVQAMAERIKNERLPSRWKVREVRS